MSDDLINMLITIRAMGVAKVNVNPGSVMSKHNGIVYPVDDMRVRGDVAQVSLNINGTVTDFTHEEVVPEYAD